MTQILCLLICAIFVQRVSCNDGLLSKFHQHTYKLKDVRFELISYDKNLVEIFELKAFKYNRTTTAHNATLRIKFDAEDKAEVLAQGYKFLSNEYRHFPIRFQVNTQKAFAANALGLGGIAKCGNVTSFRFYKDITYYACNFVIDENYLPPLIPNGKYKTEFTILYLNKEVVLLHLYGEIYTPMEYPKN